MGGLPLPALSPGPEVAIGRAVGRKQAMHMLVTGEPVPAATACTWGLINTGPSRPPLEPAPVQP